MEELSLSSSRNSKEVLGAAKQLMQLSGGSDSDDNSCNVVTAENKKDHGGGEEEVDQKRCQIETLVWLKIEEIFGKDDDNDDEEQQDCGFICRPKKRRFRSIRSVYMNTMPIVNGRFSGNEIAQTWRRWS